MRRMLWISAAAMLAFPAANSSAAWQQAQGQQSQSPSQTDSQKAQTQQASSASGSQSQKAQDQTAAAEDSLAIAARKAREQKKETPKPPKVFTNDNLPDSGGISTVGEEKGSSAAAKDTTSSQESGSEQNTEKKWRDRFAKLRHKLDQDQQELDILQRESSVDQTQFYGGDPSKAVTDQASGQPFGSDYAKKTSQIEAKKKQIEADKQAIADAEEELRKSGGDSGWSR